MDAVTPASQDPQLSRRWYQSGGFSVTVILSILLVAYLVVRWLPQTANAPSTIDVSLNPKALRGVATTNATVRTDDDPSFGNKDAKVTVVEFGDFECPYCQQVFPVLREVMQTYKDTVLFQFRDYPIDEIHPNARMASEAAQCAWEQGANQFWAFHDRLYLNQDRLTKDDLAAHASAVGLDTPKFRGCVEARKHQAEVEADYQAALALGVRGTPTFFINQERYEGPLTKELLTAILDQRLRDAN